MKLRPLSVTEVNSYIKRNLSYDPILSNLIVEGELSNYKLHSSGHAYFSLKDGGSRISCVMFHDAFKRVDFEPKDGMKIQAKGYISVYERDGKYQLYVKSMEQSGLGDLHLKFEALKKDLQAEGLFEPDIKKSIPEYPERVAVITSPTGAAVRDIVNVITRRTSYVDVVVFPVRVQGETSSLEVAEAIRNANEIGGFDTIIVGRGGGSIEELWSFNEEMVARAIFDSEIPVISAVGHETDFTISDFVSDLRAPTPSAAAELVAVSNVELYGMLNAYRSKMNDALKLKIRPAREILDNNRPDLLHDKLSRMVDTKRYDLEVYKQRLDQSMEQLILLKRQSLKYTGQMLNQMSPLKTLDRGYSIVQTSSNDVVMSVGAVAVGDEVRIKVSDGELDCKVIGVKESVGDHNG